MTNGSGDITPPYVGSGTFRNFLRSLHETGIPPVIDTSVMAKKSGGTQAALRTAFGFFGMIDDESRVRTEVLEPVAAAAASSNEAWRDAVREHLLPSYAEIVAGLPIKSGTAKQLEEKFREHASVSGSTLRKAIRFYLKMLEEGGVEHSPHFRAPRAPSTSRSRKKKAKPEPSPETEDGGEGEGDGQGADSPDRSLEIPPDWVVQPFNLPTRSAPVQVVMPADLSAREWKMISAFMSLYVDEKAGEN